MSSFRRSGFFSIAFICKVLLSLMDSSRAVCKEPGFKDLSPAQIARLKKEAESGNQAMKARKLLGIYYFEKKKYDEALEILLPVQEGLDKQSVSILARIYRSQKNYLNEIRLLEQWISRNQRDFVSIKELGDAYFKQGNRSAAVKAYQFSIEINKKYRPAYEALIQVNDLEGLTSDNRSLTLDMLRIFGEDNKILHRLCEYHYTDGFLREARTYCQRAVEKDPKYPDSHVILALTYREEQNTSRYQKLLTLAAKNFPNSEFAQRMAGQMSEDIKDTAAALKYYQRATQADPNSLNSWLRLGVVGLTAKNYELSLKAFVKACELDRSKTLEPFRTALASLRIQGINQWYKKYDQSVEKCKYQNVVVKSSKVKDLSIKETASPDQPTHGLGATTSPTFGPQQEPTYPLNHGPWPGSVLPPPPDHGSHSETKDSGETPSEKN